MSGKQSFNSNKTPRIFTIGETTYDILFRDGKPHSSCGGGSAFNSSVSLGRCGLPVSLISTFGNDRIGDLASEMLRANYVDTSRIKRFKGQSRVALAFFNNNQSPEYSFYQASEEAIPDYPKPEKNDLILLGSSFALRNTGRKELLDYLHESRKKECLIIYDPNARRHLFHDHDALRKIMENISLATIVKGSDEDFRNIYNLSDTSKIYDRIRKTGPDYLVCTKGSDGAELFTPEFQLKIDAQKIMPVSTIGAGDNFSAGMIYSIYQHLVKGIKIKDFTSSHWNTIIEIGNFFAGNVCQSSENYISPEAGVRLKT